MKKEYHREALFQYLRQLAELGEATVVDQTTNQLARYYHIPENQLHAALLLLKNMGILSGDPRDAQHFVVQHSTADQLPMSEADFQALEAQFKNNLIEPPQYGDGTQVSKRQKPNPIAPTHMGDGPPDRFST